MTSKRFRKLAREAGLAVIAFILGVALVAAARAETTPNAAAEFPPPSTDLPVEPPAGAVVLFDGGPNHQFLSMSGGPINWPIEEGALVSTRRVVEEQPNHIVSKLHFRDADLHAEFMLPASGEGNSGVYLHGNYELQICNSLGKQELTESDLGAIYGFARPLADAGRPPGKWQAYDIHYRAPRRDASGTIVEPGVITAYLNGILVQDQTRFDEPRSTYHPFRYGTTPYLKKIGDRQKATVTGPVFLQDHHAPVRFRNVWVRPLDDRAFVYELTEDKDRASSQ
jgi:hypothetical protein